MERQLFWHELSRVHSVAFRKAIPQGSETCTTVPRRLLWSANRIWLVWPLSHSYRSPFQLQRRISTKSLIWVYSREVTVPYLARLITAASLSAIQAPAMLLVSSLLHTRSCTRIAACPISERSAAANLLDKPSAARALSWVSPHEPTGRNAHSHTSGG